MPKITFVRAEDTEFLSTAEIRRRRLQQEGALGADDDVADDTDGAAPDEVETRFHLVGSDSEPQLFEPRFAPNAKVEAHAHGEDEVIHVLEGELTFGSRTFGPGSTISIPGGTLYGFTVGPAGARFLNFRPRSDRTFITKEQFQEFRSDERARRDD
jgi:quercetin dioxygenase-like cupin family protein